jgi:hypothetical protein
VNRGGSGRRCRCRTRVVWGVEHPDRRRAREVVVWGRGSLWGPVRGFVTGDGSRRFCRARRRRSG